MVVEVAYVMMVKMVTEGDVAGGSVGDKAVKALLLIDVKSIDEIMVSADITMGGDGGGNGGGGWNNLVGKSGGKYANGARNVNCTHAAIYRLIIG
jgi:hypothetical protein